MICDQWIQNMRTGQTRESMGVKITLLRISYGGDYADRYTILDLDVRGKIYLNQQLWLRGDRKWKGDGGDGSYVEIEMGTISAKRLPDFHVCVEEPIDPCEGIICPDYCDFINHIKYINGQCIDGECVYDIIENSEECGYVPPCIPNWQCEIPLNGFEEDNCGNRRYNENCEPYIDPCEDVVCNNICIGTDLYSQKCVDGLCIIDALLKENSVDYCGYIPPIEPPIDNELEPSDNLTELIIPIGLGIGLLSLLKK